MGNVRHAAVSGRFYPGNAADLAGTVDRLLADTLPQSADDPSPRAIIAPHAGYMYSGAVAASAYARLRPLAGTIRRVALIGPCHRVPIKGVAMPSADAFVTPLGPVAVDRSACGTLLQLPQVSVNDAAHADEHSIEVHIPFLQRVLGDFTLVPLVVGRCSSEDVVEVIERLADDPETLIVVSSDLSHYLDDAGARRIDAETCRAIEALDPNAIGVDQACGRIPVMALLTFAQRHRLAATTLDLRNSGDTAGDRRRVVGYGAWMFTERPDDEH
jgi:MEMO1 family protein